MAVSAGGSGGATDSVVRIVANIFISFIGAGVLGLPYAFKVAGLPEGTIIMVLVAYLSVRAMLILIDCKYLVQQSGVLSRRKMVGSNGAGSGGGNSPTVEYEMSEAGNPLEEGLMGGKAPSKSKSITYSDVGFAAFGPKGRTIVDAALLVSQVGFCCAYLIFISENLASFIHGLTQHQWLVVILPPLYFMTLIPDLGNLAIFSLLAQVSNLFAFAVVFWFDFEHLHLASNEHRKEFSISGFPFFFSVGIYCFEGAGMILSLEESVAESVRHKFRRYFIYTILSVTTLYITFGVSGYLSYGDETRDIITLNLPSNSGVDFALLVKACLSFSLFFTYPIMLFPVTALLEERFLVSPVVPTPSSSSSNSAANAKGNFYPNMIRLFLVTLTGLVVVMVPRFADLMALVGATCCTLLAFIMPAVCHLALSDRTAVDPTLNYVLVATGVVGALLGTFDAVVNITSSES